VDVVIGADGIHSTVRQLIDTSEPAVSGYVAYPWGQVWHTGDLVTIALRDRVLRLRAFDDYSDLDWLYAGQPG
jgi:2-polyprenyl-6-methoxyphenol hydroxylase-like FAD-dependent oxidoreductase